MSDVKCGAKVVEREESYGRTVTQRSLQDKTLVTRALWSETATEH